VPTVTINVGKSAQDLLTDYGKITEAQQKNVMHEINGTKYLFARINFKVPDGAVSFAGSSDNGKTWNSSVKIATEDLNNVGLDVTSDENDTSKITHIGQWFSFAKVVDNGEGEVFNTTREPWNVICRWEAADGTLSYTAFNVAITYNVTETTD